MHARRRTRLLVGEAAAAVAMLLLMLVFAAPAGAAVGDSVQGSGTVDTAGTSFHFKVKAVGSAGELDSTGAFNLRGKYTVTCLHVTGTNAWVGIVRKTSELVLIFQDGSPDVIEQAAPTAAANCVNEPAPEPGNTATVVKGGFTVTEG